MENKTPPDEIGIPVHWSEDEETGEILFDIEFMEEAFLDAINNLVQEYGGVE